MIYGLQVVVPPDYNNNTDTLGTAFLIYVPQGVFSTISAMQRDLRSPLYQQGGIAQQLALQIAAVSQSNNPLGSGSRSSSSAARRRKDALIGGSAALVAIALCVLIWWLVLYYKRRLEKKHKKLTEYVDPSWAGGVYGTHNDDRRTSFFYAEDQLDAPLSEGGLAGMWGSRLRALAMASAERSGERTGPQNQEEPNQAQVQRQDNSPEQQHQVMVASLSRTMGGMPMPEMRQLAVDPPLMMQPTAVSPLSPPPGSIGASAMAQRRRVEGNNYNRTQPPAATLLVTATTTALSRSPSQPQKPLGPRIRSKRYSQAQQQQEFEENEGQDLSQGDVTELQPQTSPNVGPVQNRPYYRPLPKPSQPLSFPAPPPNPNPTQQQQAARRRPIIRESISPPIFQFSTVDL